MNRSFLKRKLLLSAASVAILSGPVLFSAPAIADDLTISSAIKNAVSTATASNNTPGDITINTNGSITISQAGPAITLNSSNDVEILGGTTASIINKNTDGAQGILIDTGTNTTPATITGSLTMLAGDGTTIDLTGTGGSKVGIAITGNGTFTGDITTSSISVQGDTSAGFGMSSTATLNGDLNFAGSISVAPTTANETTATGITAVSLAGTITGNVAIGAGNSILAIGDGSIGLNTSAAIHGSFTNYGAIDTESFQESQNQSTGAVTLPKGSGDPIAGPAVEIGGSILGGFMNSGPDGVNTAPSTGIISSDGGAAGSPLPIVYISPGSSGVPLEIGVYAGDTANAGYSFYNRGQISSGSSLYQLAGTVDPNLSVAGVVFTGASATSNVKLDGKGFFNSGQISAAGHTTSSGSSAITVVGIGFGSVGIADSTSSSTGGFVQVGDGTAGSGLYNSGTISATAQGALGAVVVGVDIGRTSTVKSITNSGLIQAVATTTNPGTIQTEVAYAINDQSGTLSTITNSGTIQAAASPLTTPGFASAQVAVYLGKNTTGVNFTNTGLVEGDVVFGDGADTLTVGNSTASSQLIGNINFGGVNSSLTGHDQLNITDNGFVSGQIHEDFAGQLNISVSGAGTLNVQNNNATYGTLLVNDLTVSQNGALNIAVSSTLPNNTSISGNDISLVDANTQTLKVIYSSFVPATGQFILLQAPTGHLHIDNSAQVVNGLNTQIPFLFTGSAAYLTDQTGFDELVLNLAPKTASTLGLSGYAAQVFPYANAALANDDSLGAAMIAGITSNATAQTAYSQFAPDASGGTRAIAISLTDHATGPVAARQRALRLYATQPGDLTLWGQEFAQQISDKGSDGLPGFKDSGFGFALGADGGDALGGWYGGAFTFYTGNVDQRPPASSRDNTQWYMLSGYSTWRGKGLFLDTQLTAGYGDLSAHRFITIGSALNNTLLSRQTNSKHSSELASVGMTTGANFVYGSTTITPNIALDGMTMREEGYTETGGGGTSGDGFDLHVNPVVMGSLRGFAGVNFRQDVNFGSFFLQPELRFGYRYDFLADRIDLTASFPGVTATSATGPGTGDFTITGPQPTKGNLLAGASVAATTGAWSIGLNYDLLSGSHGSMTQNGTVSLVGRI